MIELLKCPFCGGEAEFVKMGIAKDIPLGFVRCTECGIRLRQENYTEDFARDEWNTRTPMANIVEKLEDELLTSQSAHTEAVIGMCGVSASGYSGEISAYTKAINIVKQEINKEN